MTKKTTNKEINDNLKNKMKKVNIIVTSVACLAMISILIFFTIFFSVQFDVNKQIDDFFASSDEMIYTYYYYGNNIFSKKCKIKSSDAKEIVLKYLKDKKVRNEFPELYLRCGGSPIHIENDKNSFNIDNYYVDFNGRRYTLVDEIPIYPQLFDELDAVSKVIEIKYFE